MKEVSDILFLNYLSGELSSDEKLAFENRLVADSDFKLQYQNFRIAKIAGERIHHNEVKSHVLAAIKQEKKKKPKFLRFAMPIAASIALLIAALFVFDTKPNPEQLYAKYYEAPPYSASRTIQDTTDLLELSKTFFSQKKWQETISTIKRMDTNDKNKELTNKILAHSLLNDLQIERSINIFKQEDMLDQNDYWYIGLAYLKLSNIDSSMTYFEKVINGKKDFLHYNDALIINKKLNK